MSLSPTPGIRGDVPILVGRDFQELGFQKTPPIRPQFCPLEGGLPRSSQASTGERGYRLVSIINPELSSPDKLTALPWVMAL